MSASTKYMHPKALAAFNEACKDAGLRPVIVQTQGSAPASAGTHAADGTYLAENGSWQQYTAAIDLSVNQRARRLSDNAGIQMDETRIKWLLYNLARNGFVAWYRHTGSFKNNKHIHAVYAGVKMKPSLQAQVRDFLNDRTGLVGHARETFWTANSATDAEIREIFIKANPGAL